MELRVNMNDMADVQRAFNLLGRELNVEEPAAPVEATPEVETPVAQPPATPQPEPETPAAVPPAAEAITLDMIKQKVSEINRVDAAKLTDVKKALNDLGLEKIGDLQPDHYTPMYDKIKELV